MNKAEFLDTLKTELKNSKKSEYTLRNYVDANQKFLEFIKKEPDQIVPADVQLYLTEKLSHKASSRIVLVLSALKYAYSLLLQKEITLGILRPKKERKISAALTKEETRQLFNSVINSKSKLMLSLIYACGFKVNELINLKVENIEFGESQVHVKINSSKKERKLIIPPVLLEDLKRQLEFQKIKNQEYLFSGPKGRLSTRNIQKIVASLALEAGINKTVNPHSLRISYARHNLEEGVEIRKIQEQLGHAHLSTTKGYIRIPSGEIIATKPTLS